MSALIKLSRVAKQPIHVPTGVAINLSEDQLIIKGPKATRTLTIHPYVELNIDSSTIELKSNEKSAEAITGTSRKLARSIAATMRVLIANAIHGVTTGFTQKLALVGVGYKAQAKGHELSLSLGYSHPTDYIIPAGIEVKTPTPTEIHIQGSDKELVGKVAADIMSLRPVELYKGKGIRRAGQIVELKETKKK